MLMAHGRSSVIPLALALFFSTCFAVPPSFAVDAECRLPYFSNALPFRYRNQLKRIWKDVQNGTSECQTQLEETLRVIDSLPNSLKLRIVDYKVPPVRGGRMHFLTGLLPNEIEQFSHIMSNRSVSEEQRVDLLRQSVSEEQRVDLLRQWASDKLSVDAHDYFQRFVEAHEERVANFQAKLNRLSEEAKKAYRRLQAIRREKQTIIAELSLHANRELASLWDIRCPTVRRRTTSIPFEDKGYNLDADELGLSCATTSLMGISTSQSLRMIETTSETSTTRSATVTKTTSEVRQAEGFPNNVV
uniref:DUF148 domain-containing protein n=1 Tax=Steinernema glaseri TaxID=37863 RepID=A0A1I7ZVE5_9BILA